MHRKATIPILTALLACPGVCAAVLQAQGACTKNSLTGTYVFYEKGSSAVFDSNSQPYPFHWAGAFAPFVTVGKITMKTGGVGEGYFWMRQGSYNGGTDPIPFSVTVTEMNADCTGKFTTTLTLPGGLSPTIVERILVFDEGREYRAIPASIENGITSSAWLHEGHRISKPGEPLKTCGPHTALGTYLMSVENLVQFAESWPIFADALLLRFTVGMSGDLSGRVYEKLGPYGDIELPATGTLAVNPDCSFASTLNLNIQGAPVTIPIRGVLFDEGRKLYGLDVNTEALGTLYSFGEGWGIAD